eukprot:scaffold1361_cov165-Amphora_coffeaeformis.AAC.5
MKVTSWWCHCQLIAFQNERSLLRRDSRLAVPSTRTPKQIPPVVRSFCWTTRTSVERDSQSVYVRCVYHQSDAADVFSSCFSPSGTTSTYLASEVRRRFLVGGLKHEKLCDRIVALPRWALTTQGVISQLSLRGALTLIDYGNEINQFWDWLIPGTIRMQDYQLVMYKSFYVFGGVV